MTTRSFLPLLVVAAACTAAPDDEATPTDATEPTDPTGSTEPTDTVDPTDPVEPTDPTDVTDSTDVAGVTTLEIDASSYEDWAYVDLSTGTVLSLTAEQAAASTAWHVAVRRTAYRFNGGASGPGDVAVGLSDAQPDFYDTEDAPIGSVFQAATAAGELDHLTAMQNEPEAWAADATLPAFDESWYNYGFADGVISENDTVGYFVRSGEGNSYARMRVTELDFPTRSGNGIQSFTFTFDVQGSGDAGFEDDTDSLSVEFTGSLATAGELCFDFDTETTVACTGTAWDVKLGYAGRSFYLYANGGVTGEGAGGVLGPFDWSEASTWTSATEQPAMDTDPATDVTGDYVVSSAESLIEAEGWYWYDLDAGHVLRSNYRVWLIDVDSTDENSDIYAFQIVDYYANTGGASAHPSVRWRVLDAGEPVAPAP